MIKRVFLALLILITVVGCGKVYAETPVTVDLEQLPQDAQLRVLALRASNGQPKVEVEDKVSKWIHLGKDLGQALAEMGTALNIQANEFAKSPLGIWGIIILTWKLLAKEILGVFLIGFIYILLFFSFRQFHLSERVAIKTKEGIVEVKYVPRYEFASKDGRSNSVVTHVVLFVLITIVAIIALL